MVMVMVLILSGILFICSLVLAYKGITGATEDWKARRKKDNDIETIDLCTPYVLQYKNEAKKAFAKYNVSISGEDKHEVKNTKQLLLIGIMLGLKWAEDKQGKEE